MQNLDDALREERSHAGRQAASLQQDLQSARDCIRNLEASLKQLMDASTEERRQAEISSSQLQARILELETTLKEERAKAAAQVFCLSSPCCCLIFFCCLRLSSRACSLAKDFLQCSAYERIRLLHSFDQFAPTMLSSLLYLLQPLDSSDVSPWTTCLLP